MKIAIWGSGPSAIEASLLFDSIGASVTLFSKESMGGSLLFFKNNFPNTKMQTKFKFCSSALGRDLLLLSRDLDNEVLSYIDYWNIYYSPIMSYLKNSITLNTNSVLRIHKRFLSTDEPLLGGTRLRDLFRVVYNLPHGSDMWQQISNNPELFSKLPVAMLESLKEDGEGFLDFDAVIDARGVLHHPLPIGPSGAYAINEKRIQKMHDRVFYGLKNWDSFSKYLTANDRIIIVGSGLSAAFIINQIFKSSMDKMPRLSIITSEREVFKKFLNIENHDEIHCELIKNLTKSNRDWVLKKEKYESDLFNWRNLLDHEKCKIKEPQLPRPLIDVLNGANVTAIDHLIDHHDLFLTIETPAFRTEKKSDADDLKTLACDKVIVATGYKLYKDDSIDGLLLDYAADGKSVQSGDGTHTEIGFYTLGPVTDCDNDRYKHQHIFSQLKKIESNLMQFFSKTEG